MSEEIVSSLRDDLKNADPVDMLRKLGPAFLTHLSGIVKKYVDFDWAGKEQPDLSTISFEDFLVNRYDLVSSDQANAADFKKLLKRISRLEKDCKDGGPDANTSSYLSKVKDRLGDFEGRLEVLEAKARDAADLEVMVRTGLKIPKSEEAFNRVRSTLYKFNVENMNKGEEEKKRWGPQDKYDMIYCLDSLTSWLESEYARELDISPYTMQLFEVCIVKGELVTLSSDYLGGIGWRSLFITPDENAKLAQTSKKYRPSANYKTPEHVAKDPRRGYLWKGKMWTTPDSNGDLVKKKNRQHRKKSEKPRADEEKLSSEKSPEKKSPEKKSSSEEEKSGGSSSSPNREKSPEDDGPVAKKHRSS